MLDTNICIYAMKNKPAAVLKRLKEYAIDGICISSVVLAELKHGVYKSVRKDKNARALNEFLKLIEELPFDAQAAEEYGKICAYLESQDKPIDPMDMLIAAHALSQSLILVTNNVREFEPVPGLTIENRS